MKGAKARMARMQHVRLPQQIDEGHKNLISARIYEGPQSEIGRTVHLVVTPANLPGLRLLVEALEKEEARVNDSIRRHQAKPAGH